MAIALLALLFSFVICEPLNAQGAANDDCIECHKRTVRKDILHGPAATDCLSCHTVGFQQSNGFYSVTHSPSLLMDGVQCESCHGPAAEHANTQERLRSGAKNSMSTEEFEAFQANATKLIPPKDIPESVCLTCHDETNDPHFDFDVDLPRVTH